jgi:hypothetical protein
MSNTLEPTRLQYPSRAQALGRIEAKVDALVEMGAAQAAPTPPQDPRITTLARAMGDPDYHLPSGAIANLRFDDDGEVIATGLTIEEPILECLGHREVGLDKR